MGGFTLDFCRQLERERDDAIEMMKRTKDNSGEIIASQANENILLTEQLDIIEKMYQRVIAAVLDCDPIPACKREDDQLEPPWEVITRIREQRDRLAEALQKLTDCDWVITPANRMDEVRTIARDALQYLNPNNQTL